MIGYYGQFLGEAISEYTNSDAPLEDKRREFCRVVSVEIVSGVTSGNTGQVARALEAMFETIDRRFARSQSDVSELKERTYSLESNNALY